MDVKFLLSAEKEFEETVIYYNSQSEGLGFEFAAEVKHTIQRIIDYPKAWTKISKRTRRCRTNRFIRHNISNKKRLYSYCCGYAYA